MKKVILILSILFIALLGTIYTVPAEQLEALDPHNPLTWLRASSSTFGCMLEKEFQSKNRKYNCSSRRIPKGDVCRDPRHYSIGPEFPVQTLEKMSSDIEDIALEWEHADLQSIAIAFKKQMTSSEIEDSLNINLAPLPKNVQSVDIQDCAAGKSCLVIIGFDHIGGADVDCGKRFWPFSKRQ